MMELNTSNPIDRIQRGGSKVVASSTGVSVTGLITAVTGQIAFPATQNASTDGNTLDDYEESTWTPVLGADETFTNRSARYTKIGRQVTIHARVQVNAINSGSPTTITGVPFTSVTSNQTPGSVSYFSSLNVNVLFIAPYISSSSVKFVAATASTATASDGVGIFGNSAFVDFSITYFV